MKIDCVIGIDPGANGGIVCWRPNHKTVALRMPKDIQELREWLNYIKGISSPIIFLEKLSVRPDDVTVDGGGVNMGKLYRIQKMTANYEQLKTIITICEIPFVMVHPMKWQNELNLRIRRKGFKEDKAVRKRRFKDVAAGYYPDVKMTLWNADAALIMHFGRYVLQNKIQWVRENLPKDVFSRLF